MSNLKTERREHPRTDRSLPLKISKRGMDVITESRNISCSGVYCRVDKPLPLMSKIKLTLLLPLRSRNKVTTQKIKCNGVVVRSEPVIVEQSDRAWQNVAIFFTELNKSDKKQIARYIFQSFKQTTE